MSTISLEEALAAVDKAMASRLIQETETVLTVDAAGRILACDQVSGLDLPPFDKSAMDGYAVLEDDKRESYRVLEVVPAGQAPSCALEPGAAAKVMTGAPVPKGAARVIMVEDTDNGEDTVRVLHHRPNANICKQGEDIRAGDPIMTAGTKLDPLAIANLISCGVTSVEVRRKVRVAIYATGNEIVEDLDAIEPGKIMDSNGPMLLALARENGLEIALSRHVSDDRAAVGTAIGEAAETADIVLLSGGVSMGDFDFVPAAMQDAGFVIHVDSVAVKPGRPVTFATRGDCVALGMPGNPVSAFLCFHLYVRRIAAHLSGACPPLRSFQVDLGAEFARKRADRTGFVPCVLRPDGRVELLSYHGSAHLLSLCEADGFMEVPSGVKRIDAGAAVRFYPWALGKW